MVAPKAKPAAAAAAAPKAKAKPRKKEKKNVAFGHLPLVRCFMEPLSRKRGRTGRLIYRLLAQALRRPNV